MNQQRTAVKKALQKSDWIFRTFGTRKVNFLRKIWKSLVQCHLDYGSILWAPVSKKTALKYMEGPLRAFTRRGIDMKTKNYWDRLKAFKLYSIQRRNERYKVLYIWKSLNGLVPSLGLSWNQSSLPRFGPKLTVDKILGPNEHIKNLKRDSLRNFGVRIFNNLPIPLRTFKGTLSSFKNNLDKYLEICPDQPMTETLTPEARDVYGNASNSLIDWMRILRLNSTDLTDHPEKAQPSSIAI